MAKLSVVNRCRETNPTTAMALPFGAREPLPQFVTGSGWLNRRYSLPPNSTRVLLVLIYGACYIVFTAVITIMNPRYRAPWLWPNKARTYSYRRLVYAFAAFASSLGASIYLLQPRPLIVVAFLLPILTLLVTFLRLERRRGPLAVAAALAVIGIYFLWLMAISIGGAEPDVVLNATMVRIFIALGGTGGILAAILPPIRNQKTSPRDPRRILLIPSYVYGAAAFLLITILIVLPTAAFFKAAYKIEIESFVKYGQISLLRQLQQRQDRLAEEQLNARREGRLYPARRESENLDLYYRFFFGTSVHDFQPTPAETVPPPPPPETWRRIAAMFIATPVGQRIDVLPEFMEVLLPQYSEDSVEMRELLHHASKDGQWQWDSQGETLVLHSEDLRGRQLRIISDAPRILSRPAWLVALVEDSQPSPRPRFQKYRLEKTDYPAVVEEPVVRVIRLILMMLFALAYVAALIAAVRFILRKVFLADVREPVSHARGQIGPVLSGNLLIFAPDRESALRRIACDDFVQVCMKDFDDQAQVAVRWREQMTKIDLHAPGKGVLIPDLDHGADDDKHRLLKLAFLESATSSDHCRNVVAVTTVSPWVFMDTGIVSAEEARRWRSLLALFTVSFEDPARTPDAGDEPTEEKQEGMIPNAMRLFHQLRKQLQRLWQSLRSRGKQQRLTRQLFGGREWYRVWRRTRKYGALRAMRLTIRSIVRRYLHGLHRRLRLDSFIVGSARHTRDLMREESIRNPFLKQLGKELSSQRVRGESELFDEIAERAASYYLILWQACSTQEKVVLHHVARDGFANAHNRQTIRKLMARGLLRRSPHLRVMNESFRRFVTMEVRRAEVASFDTALPLSPWDRIQRPLMLMLVGSGIFFFLTQRELFDVTMAIITGLAGGIPALVRAVGFFVEPRLGAAAKS